LIQMETSL
jgi:hypothetical protein